MEKIPTLFKRDPEDMKRVLPEVTPGCEWVIAGEGWPTQKYDGTCVMLDEKGAWWARREVKPDKRPPENFRPIGTDENTGKTVGWEPIEQSPFAKFHAEAVEHPMFEAELGLRRLEPGTYELCGPKINKNPEGYPMHTLVRHATAAPVHAPRAVGDVQRTFDALRDILLSQAYDGIEGIVWHHRDGRMAKLKRRDFPRSTVLVASTESDEG